MAAQYPIATTAREDIYRLLAACYYAPTPALLEEDCCGSLATLLEGFSAEAAAHAAEAARLLRETTVETLLVEHTRLFVGPFKLVAAPYGSVWLDEYRQVMGDSTAGVAAFYHSCGLHLADDFHELPDHFAVELEFNAYLAFKQREAHTAGDTVEMERLTGMQRKFLATFLLPWLTPFTGAVISDGEAPFYVALARCTAAFITADAAALNETSGD